MSERPVIEYRVGQETNPRALLLSLAAMHGIQDGVEQLLEEQGETPLVVHPLKELLPMSRRLRDQDLVSVCRRSGMSRSQLAAYEDGDGKNPGIRTIQALSYGYRIPFMLVLMSTLQTITFRSRPRRRPR